MRIYYYLRAFSQRWKYKIKYGFDIDEPMKELGRYVILTEQEENNDA